MLRQLASLAVDIVKVLKYNPQLTEEERTLAVETRLNQLELKSKPPFEYVDYSPAFAFVADEITIRTGQN